MSHIYICFGALPLYLIFKWKQICDGHNITSTHLWKILSSFLKNVMIFSNIDLSLIISHIYHLYDPLQAQCIQSSKLLPRYQPLWWSMIFLKKGMLLYPPLRVLSILWNGHDATLELHPDIPPGSWTAYISMVSCRWGGYWEATRSGRHGGACGESASSRSRRSKQYEDKFGRIPKTGHCSRQRGGG